MSEGLLYSYKPLIEFYSYVYENTNLTNNTNYYAG